MMNILLVASSILIIETLDCLGICNNNVTNDGSWQNTRIYLALTVFGNTDNYALHSALNISLLCLAQANIDSIFLSISAALSQTLCCSQCKQTCEQIIRVRIIFAIPHNIIKDLTYKEQIVMDR